jgi:hypothetical protein
VIDNDMGEIGFDTGPVRNGVFPSRTEERPVEIADDCVYCTLREDLPKEAGRSAAEGSRRAVTRPWFRGSPIGPVDVVPRPTRSPLTWSTGLFSGWPESVEGHRHLRMIRWT